jgi:hypothetical protein
MIPADGAVIDDNVPCPERYCVPLPSQIHHITSSLPQQRAHKDNDNGACVLTFLTSNRFLLSFSMALDLDVVAGVSTGSTSTSMSAMVAMKAYSGGGNACQIRFRLCG